MQKKKNNNNNCVNKNKLLTKVLKFIKKNKDPTEFKFN